MRTTSQLRIILSSNLLLFLSFAFGFLFWRGDHPLVWDDTSVYKIAREAWKVGGREDWLATFLSYIGPAFAGFPGGYRPVASLLQSLWILTIDSIQPAAAHVLAVGSVLGALAVAFKAVASRFLQSIAMVYFCVALFMFSSPATQSSWIIYSGIPALVPLFTCIGLTLYFRQCEASQAIPGELALLCLIVIIAVWYREFIVALPLTILGMEVLRAGRVTNISVVAGVLTILCLFPTALPKLVLSLIATFANIDFHLPLKPVFSMGNVQQQLSAGLHIREEVSRHILSVPSPSLLILAFLGFVGSSLLWMRREWGSGTADSLKVWVALLSCLTGAVALVAMALPPGIVLWPAVPLWPYHLGVLTFLLIAWCIDLRLAVWTICFLTPFYFVYTERVHLAYVMLPVSIVIAAVLERCLILANTAAGPGVALRALAGLAVAFGTLDAVSHLVSVRRTMTQISIGTEVVARKLQDLNSNRPVAIISNALHADDLRLYLSENHRVLWTIAAGHNRPHDVIESPKQLSDFLKSHLDTTDIYLLDIRHDYLTQVKKMYHQHRFVAACSANTSDLGLLHLTQVEYFMPDPLRWADSRAYFAFLGPPDLVDDFYYGPAQRPLFGKVEAEYRLHKVMSPEVREWLPMDPVKVVDSDFGGFSIVSQGERFFAIPSGEGFAYERFCRRRYSSSFESSDLNLLKAMVKGSTSRP